MDSFIKETKDYILHVVEEKDELGVSHGVYGITHKEYGVLEMTTSVLPQALEWIETVQGELNRVRAGKPGASVISFNREEI